MNLRELPEWKMALDNLEQMSPRYLAELVESGDLEKVLNHRVEAYHATLARMHQRSPNADPEQLQEIAQSECLTPVNPDWQDQEPLSGKEKKALKAYLASLRKNRSTP